VPRRSATPARVAVCAALLLMLVVPGDDGGARFVYFQF